MKPSILTTKSFDYALLTVETFKKLKSDGEYVLSTQLLRSANSVGANIREATSAQTKKDFIHKLSIAQKECNESLYWLELLKEAQYISNESYLKNSGLAKEVFRMLISSIKTAKRNLDLSK